MEVQVDRKALRKLSGEFRSIASRLLRCEFHDSDDNLKRFIRFIESNPVIRSFIDEEVATIDVSKYPLLQRDNNHRWNIPTDPSAEFVYVYSLLRLTDEGAHNFSYQSISSFYDRRSSSKIQDSVDAFNKSVVLPFIQRIERHIQNLMTDAGMNDSDKVSVQVSDGSVYVAGSIQGSNVAAKDASVADSTATYSESRSLVDGVTELRSFLNDVPVEQREEAEGAIEVLVKSASGEEIAKPVLAEKVDLLARLSPQMKNHLANLLVNAGGSVAAHLVIQTIMFVLGKSS